MSTVSAAAELPRLPWELMDAIIDHLQTDLPTLGQCGMVSSAWLKRSRHHIFSTVQLWPWRIRNFIQLSTSEKCTFSNSIQRVELDDSRVRPNVPCIQFTDALSLSHLSCLSQVEAIQIRHVDWTALSPIEQKGLRRRFAQFKMLKVLEFDDVTFHDLREVVNIMNSFPLLKHLSANVCFMKYTEHAVASASQLRLPKTIDTLELGTDDGIPVVLTSLLAQSAEPHVTRLNLRNLKAQHLPYLRTIVRKIGSHVRHLLLGMDRTSLMNVDEGDYIRALKLSRLSQLRTLQIEGLEFGEKRATLEATLPDLISRLESPFLRSISATFTLKAFGDLETFHWKNLQRVFKELHFFGLKSVEIRVLFGVEAAAAYPGFTGENVEGFIRTALHELDQSGALMVTASSYS